MTGDDTVPLLGPAELLALARRTAGAKSGCTRCAAIRSSGWESLPSDFDRARLERFATLRDPRIDEPTLRERHPAGTHLWSPEAPIAVLFHPYNRCDVWRCVGCSKPFLRYTEYGGYYEDARIRELDASLIDDHAPD